MLNGFSVIKRESPDFLLDGEGKRIGVELTELILSALRARESLENLIINTAREFYEERGGPPLIVDVKFQTRLTVSRRDAGNIGNHLGKAVFEHVQQGEGVGRIIGSQLPSVINSANFAELLPGARAVWGANRFGAMPDVSVDVIQSALEKKSLRLTEYKKVCDEAWLLICIEDFQPSTWYQIEGKALNWKYETSFDRVYILDYQNGRSVRLETKQ